MFNRSTNGLVTLFTLACVSVVVGQASAQNMAGEGEAVKALPSREFEGAKKLGLPMCVYLYDPNAQKTNAMVKALEGTVLANAELRDKLKPFQFLKIRSDGSDVKGWPQEWREYGDKGAALLFTTSDLKSVVVYDRFKGKDVATIDNVEGTIKQILAYEEKKKEIAGGGKIGKEAKDEKEEKPSKPEPVAQAIAKALPGLDKDNPLPKPAEKKKPNPADRDE